MSANRSVTTAVLFTDLVGSTELASRVGPMVAEELRGVHFGLLRGAISGAGGTEVKNLGDGFMVVFSSVSRGLACAVAMQQAIERHNYRGRERLQIRVGVSAGECVEEDGDYFGEPVVEAARLCAIADPGQILVTELACMMVGRRSTHPWTPLGHRTLKGLPEPVAVAEVSWEPETSRQAGVAMPGRLVAAASNSLFGFFGRTAELEQLRSLYKQSAAGDLRVALVSGEPGIGKSTLVAQFARDAHDLGATVLFGHCDEDLSVPYQPWIEALTHWIEHAPADRLEAQLAAHGRVLSRLLPSLGRSDGGQAVADVDPETERYLLFQAITEVLGSIGSEEPAVVVLDDLHWSDAGTCQLIRHMLTSGRSARMLVVGTYRNTDLPRAHPFTTLLAGVRPEAAVTRMSLAGLDDNDVTALCEAAAGHRLDESGVQLAHALRQETAGNPYFTSELIRDLVEAGDVYQDEHGRWTSRRDLDDLGLPGSLREVIGTRISRLGEDVLRVLTLAAVIGRDFDLDLLALVTEMSQDELLDLLDTTVNAAIITEGDRAGQFTFSHALVQHTLANDLSATRRQRAHRRIAEALEDLCGDKPDDRLNELAHHWAAAVTNVDRAKAASYAERAGDAALAALAPGEAARWYGQALEIHSNEPAADEGKACDLTLALGHALWQSGDVPAACAAFLDAAASARRLVDPERLAEAALGFAGSGYRPFARETGAVDEQLVALLHEAIAAIGTGDAVRRVRLLGTLAQELYYDRHSFDERDRLSAEAMRLAGDLDNAAALAFALGARHAALRRSANVGERLDLARSMAAVASRAGLRDANLHAHRYLLNDYLELGDFEAADAEAAIIEGEIAEHRSPFFTWAIVAYRGMRAIVAGSFEVGERLVAEAAAIGENSANTSSEMDFYVQIAVLRRWQGRAAEIVDAVPPLLERYPTLMVWQAALAMLLAETGRRDEARVEFEKLATHDFSGVTDDLAYVFGLAMAAEACCELADADRASVLATLLRPYADHAVVISHIAYMGPVTYYLGRLETCAGHHEEAERHLSEALDTCGRLQAAPCAVFVELAQADLAFARSGPGDEGVTSAYRVVEEAAARLGMEALVERARAGLGPAHT